MSFFPSSVPTALQLLEMRNNKSVTLSSAINDVVTTIPVTDTSDIPTAGYLTFEDGSNECIQYTGVTPTSLTGVTRGADGTTASSHSNGGTIGMWVNARYHNILSEEIIAITQNLSDRLGLSATQILSPDGTVSLPSHSFAADPDTGIYRVTANTLGIVSGGSEVATFTTHVNGTRFGFSAVFGDAASPSYTFTTDQDTGFYRSSADVIGFAIGGGNAGLLGIFGGTTQFQFRDGAVTAPAMSFVNDPDTGIYRPGANQIAIAVGGTAKFAVDSAGGLVFASAYLQGTDGTAAAPSYSFSGDPDTGIYRVGANAIGFATIGTLRMELTGGTLRAGSVNGMSIENGQGDAVNPSYSFHSDSNTGMYWKSSDSIGFTTNGVLRVTIDNNGLTVNSGTLSASFTFADGTVGAPSFAFASQTNTGFYREQANSFSATSNGVRVASFYNINSVDVGVLAVIGGFISGIDGTAAQPCWRWDSDSNSGIYRIGADHFGFATAGTLRWQITSAGEFAVLGGANNQILASAGTVSAPAYSFNVAGATDTGIYQTGTGSIRFASDGVNVISVIGTGLEVGLNGSAASPAINWGADPDTGIYRVSANVLGIAVGGVDKFRVNVANSANDVTIEVYDFTAASLKQVSRGASDSGGTGFRVLRIPN